MTFQDKLSAHLSRDFSENPQLLFSLNPSRRSKPLLEGQVVSIDSSDDSYLCTLLVEPLGRCEINLSGSTYLPRVGESFLVPLSVWTSKIRGSDLVWPAKSSPARVRYRDRYYRFLTFTKLGSYSVSSFFVRNRYFVKPRSVVFPIKKKGQFCYPVVSTQFLFLPRNLHRSLLRSNVAGFSAFFHLFSPLIFSSLHSFSRFEGLLDTQLISFSNFSLSSRIALLFRLLPSCTIRRLRKKARNVLSRVIAARQLAQISTNSFAPALGPVFFDRTCLLFLLPSSVFSTFLQLVLFRDSECAEIAYNPLFYYKGLVYKHSYVAPWLANSRKYSPLMSVVPSRRKPRRLTLLRKLRLRGLVR